MTDNEPTITVVDGIDYADLNLQGRGDIVTTVNGHRIREWHSRIGRVFTVGNTNQASCSQNGAEGLAFTMGGGR